MAEEHLHRGKRGVENKYSTTPAMSDHLNMLAHQLGCSHSDLVNDAVFLAYGGFGKTFAEHVADDRRAVINVQRRQLADKAATENAGCQEASE